MATYTCTTAAQFRNVMSDTVDATISGWSGTLSAGDVIELVAGTTYDCNALMKENLGVAEANQVTVRVQNYSSNFTNATRALLGTDDANCAHIQSQDANSRASILDGGKGSWWVFQGIKFTADDTTGTQQPTTTIRGGDHNKIDITSTNTVVSATANTITLNAGETTDWDDTDVTILVTDTSGDVVDRGKVSSYDTGTKIATMQANWTTQPTGTDTYTIGYRCIEAADQGKLTVRHCLFDWTECRVANGACIESSAQLTDVDDCDFISKAHDGTETKIFLFWSGRGPHTVTNCRTRNAVIHAIAYAPQILTETPNAAAGCKIDYCSMFNDPSVPVAEDNVKNFIEIKGGENWTIERCLFGEHWDVADTGPCIVITESDKSDGRSNLGHTVQWCKADGSMGFFECGGFDGQLGDNFKDVTVKQCLAIVGWDPRDESAATNPALGISVVNNLHIEHCTIVGDTANRRLGDKALVLSGAGSMPDLYMHANVFSEGEAGFSFGPESTWDSVCGAGSWTSIDNAVGLGEFDAPGNYPTMRDNNPESEDWFVGGGAAGDGQAFIDGIINTTTYQVTDTGKVSSQDATLIGVDVTTLNSYLEGVDTGVPTQLQSTTDFSPVTFIVTNASGRTTRRAGGRVGWKTSKARRRARRRS